MRGTVLTLYRGEVVTRWVGQLCVVVNDLPIRYCLEDFNGGADPRAAGCHSIDDQGRASADCIGFVLHGSGIDRKQPGYKGLLGEWLNCKSLWADAAGAKRFCRFLSETESPAPGDWLLSKTHIGGILRPATKVSDMLVIDCSPRHGREHAIGIGGPWPSLLNKPRVVRPLFYAEA